MRMATEQQINDITNNNCVEEPIKDLTLRKYFHLIAGCILGACDKNGHITGPDGKLYWWNGERKTQDMRTLDPIYVARMWSDGRGLFTEHFNTNSDKTYGDWENIGPHSQNQWFHEDRLDDVNWFKQCVLGGIGRCGHPTELLTSGNFTPIYHEEADEWTLRFDMFSRNDYYTIKSYIFLRQFKVPAYIYGAQTYLTEKQINALKARGLLQNRDYNTGYYIEESR